MQKSSFLPHSRSAPHLFNVLNFPSKMGLISIHTLLRIWDVLIKLLQKCFSFDDTKDEVIAVQFEITTQLIYTFSGQILYSIAVIFWLTESKYDFHFCIFEFNFNENFCTFRKRWGFLFIPH